MRYIDNYLKNWYKVFGCLLFNGKNMYDFLIDGES